MGRAYIKPLCTCWQRAHLHDNVSEATCNALAVAVHRQHHCAVARAEVAVANGHVADGAAQRHHLREVQCSATRHGEANDRCKHPREVWGSWYIASTGV